MSIPEGFKLVPVEPNDEMAAAAIKVSLSSPTINGVEQYRAMLAAAPNPPQLIYDEASDLVAFERWVTEECERDDTEPDFSLADNGEYENDTLNIARRAWLAGAQSRAKSVEVGHEQ